MGKVRNFFSKKIVIIITVILVLALIAGACVGLPFAFNIKGKISGCTFSPALEYSADDGVLTTSVQMGKGDFVILNITDVHFNASWYNSGRKIALDTIRALVDSVKPDLITLTGDNAWPSTVTPGAFNYFVDFMDSFGIAWAPVMGNHEGDGSTDTNYVADKFLQAKNCIFLKGPNNIGGVGNYIVNIMQCDKIMHSFFMMDSGSERYYPEFGQKDYEFISPAQQMWYLWGLRGAIKHEKSIVESTILMHIPVPEYEDAYTAWEESGFDPEIGYGKRGEKVWSAPINGGFFDFVQDLGITKNIISGHDHINDYSILYKGVRLTYAVKTGKGSYWDSERSGGTVIKINTDGEAAIEQKYIKV